MDHHAFIKLFYAYSCSLYIHRRRPYTFTDEELFKEGIDSVRAAVHGERFLVKQEIIYV